MLIPADDEGGVEKVGVEKKGKLQANKFKIERTQKNPY